MSGEAKHGRVERAEFEALRTEVDGLRKFSDENRSLAGRLGESIDTSRQGLDSLRGASGREFQELRMSFDEIRREFEALKSSVGSGMTLQRPRPLTRIEVEGVLEAKPDQLFLVLAPFPAAGLSPGDRFDVRTRFARAADFALHVDRGLQVTIPPQA
jgi:hypothetical protein